MAKPAKLRMNHNLEAELEAMLAPQMEEYSQELNQVLSEHQGGSVDEIHEALIEVTERHGLKPNVEELRKLAQQHAG